jgi:hypothetical protein
MCAGDEMWLLQQMQFKSPVLVRLVCWSEVKHGGAFVICIVIIMFEKRG